MDRTASSPTESPQAPEQILFPLLAKRGIAKVWANTSDPLLGVSTECQRLSGDAKFMSSLKEYLEANPIIRASCDSMLAQLALAAGVRWQDTAPVLQPLSRRGWYIGRWLPTFLLISGPLGWLLKDKKSPLSQRLRAKDSGLPLLSAAMNAFNNETFKQIRNGFGHWSFEWVDEVANPILKIVNWETGKETARVSLLECEALHFLTCRVVHAIDKEIFVKFVRNQAQNGPVH